MTPEETQKIIKDAEKFCSEHTVALARELMVMKTTGIYPPDGLFVKLRRMVSELNAIGLADSLAMHEIVKAHSNLTAEPVKK